MSPLNPVVSAGGAGHELDPVSHRQLAIAADVGEFLAMPVLDRFTHLIEAPSFPEALLAEPILFDARDPIYGYACGVTDCARSLSRASRFCIQHQKELTAARKAGISEPDWLASAIPGRPHGRRTAIVAEVTSCRICPERDAFGSEGFCKTHSNSLSRRRGAALRQGRVLDEDQWLSELHPLPGYGPCAVTDCPGRCPGPEMRQLCELHWRTARNYLAAARRSGIDDDDATFAKWVAKAGRRFHQGELALVNLSPLAAAEFRYVLYAHTQGVRPANWFPAWLRSIAELIEDRGLNSITELDLESDFNESGHTRRIVQEMQRELVAIHTTRDETRALGYIDTWHWGFRFPNRRSPFDLTAIRQNWLRELAWDFFADSFDSPSRNRTQSSTEGTRRAIVSLSTYLHELAPRHGNQPELLTESHARGFVADLTRRAERGEPVLGVFLANGDAPDATEQTRSIYLGAIRRVMRWGLERGATDAQGLPREFVVHFPPGGGVPSRRPRPLPDDVYSALVDPANCQLLNDQDRNDLGIADIWFIQVRCGRRIGEVIGLRHDCISEHEGRTWAWFDMTKVGLLDYGVPIPRNVYDVIVARQAKTAERFRLAFGHLPTAEERRTIALFPSPHANPTMTSSITQTTFSNAYRAWLVELAHEGFVPHQARHTLATRLLEAGASMSIIKQVLGHVSERMTEHYTQISGTMIEPFLQQVWVRGPGSELPGEVVLTPTDVERASANNQLIDLAVLPTEHGLCTFKPVVGGDDCPFERNCNSCEHFVLTGADYAYWKRQEQRWSVMAENAPDDQARDYVYEVFAKSSQAIAGLEKALLALGLLDEAKDLDLRNPHQDFFSPLWSRGWTAGDLVSLGNEDLPQHDPIEDAS
jgi:integrase